MLSLGHDVRKDLAALPRGAEAIGAITKHVVEASGHDSTPLFVNPSQGLPEALHRLYSALGVTVDESLAQRISNQVSVMAHSDAQALAALIDALRVAHVATESILPAADVAMLRDDLATTLKLTTFVGSAAKPVRSEWQSLWDARAAVLASADLDMMGRAATTVAHAVSQYLNAEKSDVAGGCEPSLDLPFIREAGTCDDTYAAGDLYLLLIDNGGDDTYHNGMGAGLIAGAGVGVGIDRGAGTDTYAATSSAQGFGLAGVGILVDEGGPDRYEVTQFGQGFAVAGFGGLFDQGDDDDQYLSPGVDPIGTKAGSLAGIGLLVDDGGNDYYHQDGLDGFVYGAASGAGWMLERGGDDTYRSDAIPIVLLGDPLGTFAGPVQISGEVGGTTVLYEASGTDTYICGDFVRQGCQGAAGAGSITLLLEDGGDDTYSMGQSFSAELVPGVVIFPMGQGAGYGPSAPGGLALLHDVSGNDAYTAEKWAQGFGTSGVGVFMDGSGLDSYSLGKGMLGARDDGATWVDGQGGVGADR